MSERSLTAIRHSKARQQQLLRVVRWVLTVVLIFYAIFPAVWVLSASLDPRNSLAQQALIPPNASLENYRALFNNPVQPFGRWMLNSIKISTITSILAVMISALAAYAFSRFRFAGRRNLLLTILLIQVFPNFLAMVAIFLLLQQLGTYIPWLGLGTHGGLILAYLGGALGINTWLMKGFFDSIPRDLDESAKIDGASDWQIFSRIIFPLVRPILAVVGILTFIGTYSDYILASILLKDRDSLTLAVGLFQLIDGQYSQKWGLFAAGAILGAVPIVIVYLLLQDYIVGGLTQGAVKG
ncbi:arabinogalactan oligomer / maltooligosaccharide transport system permease protein [Ardenticatena maritima]|uniref:Arabinogalactan oligomer / maltooligosaccharide transport system permease protein n=1 Tax=Ardenticatena maritima TaxID=872965 RepID=A0A0M8K923_9CHLR|nr:maltose ABC transporter permease MalG [Ardenticatena maritima]KPL87723.1 maltose ABC transporter permease [Ardenticatena maritima]GAP63331.1 arabinogalactan oligomer / maltooligosaccharide transport system permease protein [Ardenticatena maritima]